MAVTMSQVAEGAASEDLLSTSEAAKLLHVSAETLRRLTARGKLVAVRTAGGHRRWRKGAVIAYAHRRQMQDQGEDTIVNVEVRPAAWQGQLRVWKDGDGVNHDIEYTKVALTGIRLVEAVARGETWKFEPGVQVMFNDVSHNCCVQLWFSATGTSKAVIEAEIAVKLPEFIEEIERMVPVQGIAGYRTPEGRILSAGEGM